MKIESGIPIPQGYRPRTESGKVAKAMKTGDSVLCDDENTARCVRYAIYTSGGKATIRKEGGGWRVWRIA